MFFILRMVFWLAVVALLLPAPPGQHEKPAAAGLSANLLADKAVGAALSYCTANPQQCVAGLAGARQLGGLFGNDAAQAPPASATPLAQRLTALPPPRPAIP